MKILGFDYELIYTNDSGYIGMCEPAKLQIHIDPYAPLQRKFETIIHEIIEAINIHTELRLKHRAIVTLAVVLHQVFSEGGVNLKPLLGELKK
jgi:hypothetical protein